MVLFIAMNLLSISACWVLTYNKPYKIILFSNQFENVPQASALCENKIHANAKDDRVYKGDREDLVTDQLACLRQG